MKKIRKQILSVLLLAIVFACSKEDALSTTDPDPTVNPDPENQAPGSFNLLEVTDGETNVDLIPNFTWDASTDPDGDMVKYDFFLFKNGMDDLPENKLATDLNTTLFQLENRLSLLTEYNWNVKAKDDIGNETNSNTYSFITRNLNVPEDAVIEETNFSSRSGHTVTFFKDQFWLIGGEDGDETKQDIFHSSNGIDWTAATGELPGARTGHTTVVFNDTLWILGGRAFLAEFTKRNRVFSSADGLNFTAEANAPWSAREGHTTAVFKDKVWVLGGLDADRTLFDVWSSSDVSDWEVSEAEWTGRFGHSTVVFDDKLWVIGGEDSDNDIRNDVWYSNDGSSWVNVTQQNPFPKRKYHKSVVFDNKIWLFGGLDEMQTRTDIWYSEDGANWFRLNETANFNGRINPALAISNEKILMIGGLDGAQYRNDIWVFD